MFMFNYHEIMKIISLFFVLFVQKNDGSSKISGNALKDLYKSFAAEYPIVSIEDPFDQDDWEHYSKMTAEIGEKVQIVGDDLLVTNPKVCTDSRFIIESLHYIDPLRMFCFPSSSFSKQLRSLKKCS